MSTTRDYRQKPHLFVASSAEGLDVARAVQQEMDRDADTYVWPNGVFRPTDFVWEGLEAQLDAADCGLFVLTPDDLRESRGTGSWVPRDNVILELGLFGGRLGRRRAVALVPRGVGVELPSDLLGIVPIDYEPPPENDPSHSALRARIAPACTTLRDHLKRLPVRGQYLSWEDTCDLVRLLRGQLNRSPADGGFKFDVIVGITPGGIIVADLLCRTFGGRIPYLSFWGECDRTGEEYTFTPDGNQLVGHAIAALADKNFKRILVIDDVVRRGQTMARAKQALVTAFPEKLIKTAALLHHDETKFPVDFATGTLDRQSKTPWRILDE